MATETSKLSKTARVIIGLLAILVAILFWLVLRVQSSQNSSALANNISIRQDSGNIQWKLPGGDWQTITTVSTLTGQAGKDGAKGADGQDGADGTNGADGQAGANGKDGQDGANGANGSNGQDGADGATGATGAQGEQGVQGIQGEQGVAGQDGAQGAQGEQGVAGADGQDGADGVNGTNGTNGTNGVDGADGTDGREIELQKDLYYIQWRFVGEPGWRNLIAYSDLKGEKGDTGATGATGLTGATGPANTLSIGSVTKPADCTPTASITGTAPNQTLNLGIPGLPNGGTTGQVLTKNSSADCDAVWANTNVIIGAGRPDISASMDAGTQAKVTSATSGTEFRSTDGPQGAWVWMKQGSKWVVTSGDTGWKSHVRMKEELQAATGNTGQHDVFVRRMGQEVMFNIAGTNPSGPTTVSLPAWVPLWMRPEAQLVVSTQQQVVANGYSVVNPNGNVSIYGLSGYLRGLAQYPVTIDRAWPTNFID